jgi:glutamate-1-semialdehyde 2,1-aminomutase
MSQNARSGSQREFARAKKMFPGGVNSPVRAFRSVGGEPVFIDRAAGAYLWDVDGNRYVDYVGSWGPAILGHAHPEVVQTVKEAAERGLTYGAPHSAESTLAELIQSIVPSMEMMRFVSSGTEACMAAIRVARAFTGRDHIVKFSGCYHGHADFLLVQAGSGVATFGLPDSPGVPGAATQSTLVARYNDAAGLEEIFSQIGDKIAAVIFEPILGNAGFIRPTPEFLAAIENCCRKHQSLMIFDEVMTGFRVGLNCAQGLFKMKPDLTTLGKVVGGGMPLAVFGGRRDVMAMLAPEGKVYQAGTLSGNPLAVACGIKTLQLLTKPGFYEALTEKTATLVAGLADAAAGAGIPLATDYEGGMFGFFFGNGPVRSYEDAKLCNSSLYKEFFLAMLSHGIYLAPSAFEAGFMSAAHSNADLQKTVTAAVESMRSIAK